MEICPLERLDFARLIPSGALVTWSEGAGEPTALTTRLVAQQRRLEAELFVGVTLSDTLQDIDASHLTVSSYCTLFRYFDLFERGAVDIRPWHYSRIADLRPDVLLIQVTPPDRRGQRSLGTVVGHNPAYIAAGTKVVAQENPNLPWTGGDAVIGEERIDMLVPAEAPLEQLVPRRPGPVEHAIGGHVARLVPDRATLEFGIGSIPAAVQQALAAKRDLAIHTGLLDEAAVDFIESGAVTNRFRETDPGLVSAGFLFGTPRLYRYANRNPAFGMRGSDHIHGPRVLGALERFFAINSAIEVDLTGQVNAEALNGRYIGAIGGQGDFQRAALHSPGGRGIVALPSTAGRHSRIVARLSGPVTTARADADVVVTEHGIAELAGRTLQERARAMIAIADPAYRRPLEAALDALA